MLHLSWRSTTIVICAVAGAVALALALYPLTLANALFGIHPSPHGYNDGVYLAAAVRLVHGVLPYRDFLFLQPPGVTILMAPAALVGLITGTDGALAAARILSALFMGANAVLAALAVRSRGRIAMAVAGGALALYPLAISASGQDDLETYVVCFCLLAVVLAFSRAPATMNRLFLAGSSLGFATAVKLSAVAPAVILIVCFAPGWRRVRTTLIGSLVGFGVPCAVFFSAAPALAFHDVLAVQLGRMDPNSLSVGERLVMISGIGGALNLFPRVHAAETLTALLLVMVAVIYVLDRHRMLRLEWYVLGATLSVLAEMLLVHEFYDHYAYLPAAFLALMLGVVASHIAGWLRDLARRGTRYKDVVVGISTLAVVGAAITVAWGVPHIGRFDERYLAGSLDPRAAVDAVIPAGRCVITDEATILLAVDRMVPAEPHCPALIDPYGMFLAYDHGYPPPGLAIPPSFSALWQSDMASADVVLLSIAASSYVPWDPSLIAYFDTHFRLVSSQPNAYVYTRLPGH